MARTDTSLAVLSDTLHLIHSRMERFIAEFEWAEKAQVEPYGPKPLSALRSESLDLCKRRASLDRRIEEVCTKAAAMFGNVDAGFEILEEAERIRKDAKAWLKDCEAWLSAARVAIPYKLGVDGRPLGKE